MDNLTRSGRRCRRFSLPALIVSAALIAASCGGDDDDSSGAATTAESGTETTAEAGAERTTAEGAAETTTAEGGAETTASEGGADTTAAAGGGSEGAARAKEIVDEFLQRPTSIELDTPIDAEIPTGQRIYFISCGVDVCEAEADMAAEAAEILGWEVTKISTDGTPPSVQAAWEQVVREQPDGVLFTGTAVSQIQNFTTQAAANGTSIVACCITDEPSEENGIIWTTSTPEQTGELGEITAAWVVNDAAESGEDSPGAVYLDLPDFPILSALAENTEATYSELCPDCAYETLTFGLADLGAVNDNVVSFLRSNPDTKYVITSTASAFTGLPGAFSAAGLDDVKIITASGPSLVNQANIAAGTEAAGMAFAFYEVIWGMMDAIARDKAGVEVPEGFPPPNWILTADNLPAVDEYFPLVEDIKEHFMELWGKSGESAPTTTG